MLVPLAGIAGAVASPISSVDALRVFVDEYGPELGPVLTSVAEVESRLNPAARNVTETEDSRGVLQVNVLAHGAAAAPMGPAAGATPIAQLRAQARAARPVIEAAVGTARSIVRATGAPFVEAFDLAWQWPPARAKQLAGDAAWSVDAIARRIDMLRAKVSGAAWRARNLALRAAWDALMAYVRGAGAGAGVSIVVLLLLAWLLFGNQERRARTKRYAGAAARVGARAAATAAAL